MESNNKWKLFFFTFLFLLFETSQCTELLEPQVKDQRNQENAENYFAEEERAKKEVPESAKDLKLNLEKEDFFIPFLDSGMLALHEQMEYANLSSICLPDIDHEFTKKAIFISMHGDFHLRNGTLNGLNTLRRISILNSFTKLEEIGAYGINVEVGFYKLAFEYDALIKFMKMRPNGKLIGTLSDTKIQMRLKFKKKAGIIEIREVTLLNIGELKVYLVEGGAIMNSISKSNDLTIKIREPLLKILKPKLVEFFKDNVVKKIAFPGDFHILKMPIENFLKTSDELNEEYL